MPISDSREFYEQYFLNADIEEFRYDVGAWATIHLMKTRLPTKSRRHLNIGCGVGQALHEIDARQHVGLDYSFDTLAFCRQKIPSNAWLIQASASALPFKAGTMDSISSAHVIEHMADDSLMMTEIERVLEHDGRFVIVTPGRASGIPDEEERVKNGHYRRYHGSHVQNLMNQCSKLRLEGMERRHRILGAVWNRLKWPLRAVNYVIKKWICRDGRSLFQRPIYQHFLLPIIFWPLEFLDRLFSSRDRYPWEPSNNDFLMVWSGSAHKKSVSK